MSVSYQCPNSTCLALLKAKERAPAGKALKCPKCAQPFVPEPLTPSTPGTERQNTDDAKRILRGLTPPAPESRFQFTPGDALHGLSSWLLEHRLGGGGFGEVWLVRHEWTDERRAVKFCTHPDAQHRLVKHEKRVLVRVMKYAGKHPNIVPLLEYNLGGEIPWLMYEYIHGGTLADAIRESGKLPSDVRVERAMTCLHTLAQAVGHFHAIEPAIVHRDLKPNNVLLGVDGTLRITDFGIGGAAMEFRPDGHTEGLRSDSGRLPEKLLTSGSWGYASPEQKRGEPPDPRDDVHALGVIAYQLLVGKLDAEVKGNWQKRLRGDGVPDPLIELIGNSTSHDLTDRPTDARVLLTALGHLLPRAGPRLPEPPAERRINLTVPGTWYTRSVGQAAAALTKLAETPAEVTIQPGADYLFRLKPKVIDRDLDSLSSLSGVSGLHLDLNGCEKLTDAALAHLQSLHQLQRLDLSLCRRLTDAGMIYLRHLSGLFSLSLSACQNLTDAALAHLTKLTRLQHLDVHGCSQLTDTGLTHLLALTGLRYLDLSECGWLTDMGLTRLGELTGLRTLDLFRCSRITDTGLSRLAKLTSLEHLKLRECPGVTKDGVEELRQALPNCQIER